MSKINDLAKVSAVMVELKLADAEYETAKQAAMLTNATLADACARMLKAQEAWTKLPYQFIGGEKIEA